METVVITGASGFIGSNLSYDLVEAGYNVHGVDIEQPRFDQPEKMEMHEIDLRKSSNLPTADIIVHLAAHSQVQTVVDEPKRMVENISITQNVLDAAIDLDAFVINASSRDVYGNSIEPKEHEATPDSPNGYAASKLGSEALVNAYRQTKNVSAVSMRLANVYGPMDDNRRVIPLFIGHGSNGEELTVYGERTLLDFVHVEDVNEAIRAAIRRSSIVEGKTINIGSGEGTALTEVADAVTNAIEECPGWKASEDRDGDVSMYVSDISQAESILGFQPSISFEEGLLETIEWYRDQPHLMEMLIQ